jgi:crotonobetainyl-CoA:carnitine CoA-transferase CaiB-like acyl-CoA transferase
MAGPLSHIRVLDLSRIMAAPWSAQILADLGAEVIKVERPGSGDDTRAWGPPFLKDGEGRDTAEAGYYLAVNRGKRSITVALDTPEGQQLIRQLAQRADILVENYKVGTLARYGLDYDSLKLLNPRLIYCSVTGFGQSGPKASHAAYDFLIQAMGGLMSVTGERDDRPGGGPQKVGVPITDIMTGMYATISVLAALARRDHAAPGAPAGAHLGEHIDIGMLDVQVGFLANQAMNFLVSGRVPQRSGNAHPNIQPQNVYPCRDGQLVIVVGNDSQFEKFCAAIGQPQLAQDERFATNPQRVRHLAELDPLIVAALARHDRAHWVDCLEAVGVSCGPINSVAEALAHPQVQHRGMLRQIPHPTAGSVPQVVSPMQFREAPLAFDRAPPLLGQHTEEILAELGYDAAGIAALRAAGAL